MKKQTNADLEQAFTELVRRQRSRIETVCFMYTANGLDVEDLVQETLLNLWRGFPNFRGECAEGTWVWRVALNTCISLRRRRRIDVSDEDLATCDTLPAAATREEGEQIQQLRRRIATLGVLDRALVLLWLENLPYDEIADILGCTPQNVGVRLYRIKERLRRAAKNDD